MIQTIILCIAGFILLAFIFGGIRIIRPTERGLIERFGKYHGFAQPGIAWVIPGVDRLTKVNVTEIMVNAEPQQIITKDKLNAGVDAQVYFRVGSSEDQVKASQYNVYDAYQQIVNLSRTTLRNIIGNMSLTDANSQRGKINQELLKTLSKETKEWGIEIVRTELKEIDPPSDVQETMNKVVKAENEKQAAVDYAMALETQADGKRRAAIKEAEGLKQAAILRSEGEAAAIKTVNEAANKYFVGNAQLLRKLDVTQRSLENNTKYVLTEKGISPTIVLSDEKVLPVRAAVK